MFAERLPNTGRGRPRRWARVAYALTLFFNVSPHATAAQTGDSLLFYQANGTTVRGHFQAGLNAVSGDNVFWNLSNTTAAGSGFDTDVDWLEAYVKPGLSFQHELDMGAVLYGKLSAVSSYTLGTDAFDTGDTGDTTLEEAYIAIRSDLSPDLSFDLSIGPRELRLGTGMLIANGATSGFERGALKLGPRKAWEMAAIAKVSGGGVTGTAFYIDPNELPSTDGQNELAGFDLRYDDPRGGYLGATFVNVLNSTSPYPQAAPGGVGAPNVIPGAREGTNAISLLPGRTRLRAHWRTGSLPVISPTRQMIGLILRLGRAASRPAIPSPGFRGHRRSPMATRHFRATIRTRRSSSALTRSITREAQAPGRPGQKPCRPTSTRT